MIDIIYNIKFSFKNPKFTIYTKINIKNSFFYSLVAFFIMIKNFIYNFFFDFLLA